MCGPFVCVSVENDCKTRHRTGANEEVKVQPNTKLNPNLDVLFFFSTRCEKQTRSKQGEKKKCDDVSSLSAADGAKRGVFFGALSHVSGETRRHPLVVPWLTLTGSGVWRPPVTLERSAAQNPSLGLRVSHGGRKKSGKREKSARGFTPSKCASVTGVNLITPSCFVPSTNNNGGVNNGPLMLIENVSVLIKICLDDKLIGFLREEPFADDRAPRCWFWLPDPHFRDAPPLVPQKPDVKTKQKKKFH